VPDRINRAVRLAVTSLFATLALVCAQLVNLPSVQAGGDHPAVAAASSSAAVVARPGGSPAFATSEHASNPHAKPGQPLDLDVAGGMAVIRSAFAAQTPFSRVSATFVAIAQTAYRARAPPATGRAIFHVQLN
jgi:hypothetical protein